MCVINNVLTIESDENFLTVIREGSSLRTKEKRLLIFYFTNASNIVVNGNWEDMPKIVKSLS